MFVEILCTYVYQYQTLQQTPGLFLQLTFLQYRVARPATARDERLQLTSAHSIDVLRFRLHGRQDGRKERPHVLHLL